MKYYGIFMHIIDHAGSRVPRGDTLTYLPLLARVGPLAGADKATLSILVAALILPPHFLRS